jgi:signal transduction histidine kinase
LYGFRVTVMTMMPGELTEDTEHHRREAMGAFAHEIRTPLTSIKMVMELARRQADGGELLLDAELAAMLVTSVDDLQHLADDLQESSRIERGRVSLSHGPTDLAAALDAARVLGAPHVIVEGNAPAGLEGPWDAGRLVRAIAGFVEAANRMGNGSGEVNFAVHTADYVVLEFTSGTPNEARKTIGADAGFAYFRSRQVVIAMGGAVTTTRGDRYCNITVTLPR